ncbi:MAG: hypothetical protein IJE89_06125 [Bacilli bacterium]|nr:hypothetical protein [Bacilli bacterium]
MFYYDENSNFVRVPPIKTINNKQYYYDENRKIIQIYVAEKISTPFNSHEVYRTADNKCLKKFRLRGSIPDLYLQKMIQSMNLPNYYKVDKNFFDEEGNYRSILMPFYESSPEDILLKFSDYLTDNFTSIFSSFIRLADEKIRTNDANLENTIFMEDKIIIIDTDKYSVSSEEEKEEVRYYNLEEAQDILYQALAKAALNHPELCNSEFIEWYKQEEPKEICRKLTRYKYPIDYLRRKI